jgi:LysR family transcriptional regulator, glycine cleavage system transcriptional activator
MAVQPIHRRQYASLLALRAFEASGRYLSFTRAAELLGVTQSAISRHIKQLEAVLGHSLFRRGTRALELTPAGVTLLPGLTQAFDMIDATLQKLESSTSSRLITVSMPPTFAVRFGLNAICGYHLVSPNAEVRVHMNIDQADLHGKNIDIAIEHLFESQASPRIMLEAEQLIPICNPRVAERIRGDNFEQALKRIPLLHVTQRDGAYFDWKMWLEGAGLGRVNPERGLSFEMGEMVINAALNGAGIALADRIFVEKYLATGALVMPHNYVHRTGRGHFISADFVAAPADRVMDLYRWFIAGHWRDATFS